MIRIQFAVIAQQRESKIGLIIGLMFLIVFLLLGAGFYSFPAFFISALLTAFFAFSIRKIRGEKIWKGKFMANIDESKNSKIQLLFLGDSLMEGWKNEEHIDIWNEYFKPFNSANFGIGGDSTHQILWRIKNGELDYLNPKLIVLLAGTNNISREETPANIALSIADIIFEIKKKCANTKILLLGVFPSGKKPNTIIRKKIIALNQILLQMEDNNTIFYRDLADRFLSADGTISNEIMPDFMHLNRNGYLIWKTVLNSDLHTLMK